MITFSHTLLGYPNRPVVRIHSLSITPARCLAIVGPNGSGKTTLLRALAGLLKPLAGQLTRPADLRVAYLPQARGLDLAWPMSALDAATLATSARSSLGVVSRNKKSNVLDHLRSLRVDDLARRPFKTLSGGQQQRILLAGFLATRPNLLLLDEPTDGLDLHSRADFLQAVRQTRDAGAAVVMITHDLEDLPAVADEVAHLRPPDEPDQPSHVDLALVTAAPSH